MKKIKIIYLINELGKGGSERQLYLLLKYLDLDQADPMVIVFNSSLNADYSDAIRNLRIQVLQVSQSKKSPLKRLFWLYRLFKQEKPDVVHSWSAPDNAYAGIGGLLANVSLRLGSIRDSLQNRGFMELPGLVQKLLIHANPYLVVNASSIDEELLSKGVSPSRVFILENCTEITDDQEILNLPPVLSGDFRVVGTVCNIRRKKNVHIFIEGLAQLISRFPDLRGVVVGQSIPDEINYFNLIQQLIIDKNLSDKVLLLGFRDDAPQLVRYFEVVCLLSDFEGSPNAVLEAMAAGRPVIATDTSGIPDLVEDGVTGYLVPPGDAGAFAKALEKMLNNPYLEEMGILGRKRVKSINGCEKSAEKLLNIYRQLLIREK